MGLCEQLPHSYHTMFRLQDRISFHNLHQTDPAKNPSAEVSEPRFGCTVQQLAVCVVPLHLLRLSKTDPQIEKLQPAAMHKKISRVVELINIAGRGCLAPLLRAHKPPRMSNVCYPQSLHYITQHEKHITLAVVWALLSTVCCSSANLCLLF